jgi:hypothetical protein
MTPKDFLKDRLQKIFNIVKSINIRYEFRESEDTHLIEVTPISEYNENDTYIEMERDLLFDFNDRYFPSTILFITEDSLSEVTSPDFSFIRQEFSVPIKINMNEFNWSFPHEQFKTCVGEDNYALAA